MRLDVSEQIDTDYSTLVAPIRALAEQASECILRYYRGDDHYKITEKSDYTPLTEADLAAHDSLCAGLREIDPQTPILSEETNASDYAHRHQWSKLWLIDPLDGTREFIRRSDQFSINIALVEHHEAVFGLIHIPVTGVSYWAWRGGGAFKATPNAPVEQIRTRTMGRGAVRVAGGRSYFGRPLQTYLEYMGAHQYLAVGSSLKSCLVAEGTIDLYPRFGPTSEWDTAAAQVLVEQAGGRITDTFMRPLKYNSRPTLVNPDFFVFGDPSRDWSQYLPRRKPR